MSRPLSQNLPHSASAPTPGEGGLGGSGPQNPVGQRPRTILAEAYRSWEQCTWRERQAIQEGNWVEVAECQRTKEALQETILRATEAARRAEGGAGLKTGVEPAGRAPDSNDLAHELGQFVHHLIRLETHNAQMVWDRRQAAASEKAGIENAVRNLSRVKNSYAQPPPVVWHSYS